MVDVTSEALKVPPGRFAAFWSAFRENRGALTGLVVLGIIIFCAVFADFIAPHDPLEQFRGFTKLPPAWFENGDPRFLLGTDALGRDMLSRLMHGARISLFIGVAVMSVSMVFGVALGLSSAWFGGLFDVIVIRVMDLIVSIPSLVLAILIMAVLEPSLMNTIIAVTVVYLPRYVRLVRASALGELPKDYVTAAKVSGVKPFRLMTRTVFPELRCTADRSGCARDFRWHAGGGRSWLSRPRCTAADAGMGRHAGRQPRIHHRSTMDHDDAGTCNPDNRAFHQSGRRWPARCA